MLSINDIKVGEYIVFNGDPCEVIACQHSKMGRAGAVLRTKLKNFISGANINHTFQGSESVPQADLETKKAQYLYKSGNFFVFMDSTNYEQFEIAKESIGEKEDFLLEGCEVEGICYENKVIAITLPVKMKFKVIEAPPGLKGNTADGGSKQVKIETGIKINTPLFIKEGDIIKINTEKREYCGRVN